jgi:hypothetical protein
MTPNLAFATYAFDRDDLYWATVMAESLRTFGGRLRVAPVRTNLDPRSSDPECATFRRHTTSLFS